MTWHDMYEEPLVHHQMCMVVAKDEPDDDPLVFYGEYFAEDDGDKATDWKGPEFYEPVVAENGFYKWARLDRSYDLLAWAPFPMVKAKTVTVIEEEWQ